AGSPTLSSGKFSNGLLIKNSDQTITFPYYSNIRLEEGTFETFIIPEWDGIDNGADVTFEITKGGSVIDPLQVFVGKSGDHPVITSSKFTLSKLDDFGKPNLNKDGVYIYYD